MKKIYLSLIAVIALLASSCGTTNLGNILGGVTGTSTDGTTTSTGSGLGNILSGVLGTLGSQSTVNSLLDLVIGQSKITQSQIVGTWAYSEPGCAFTSEKLLAQAGGAVAAGQIKEKLAPVYNKVGIKSSNTYFTFGSDNKFQAKIDGVPISGTYSLDESAGSIKFSATLVSITGYVTRTTNGMALTFESKKLLTVLQTVSSLSGNSTLQTIGNLSSEFSGLRVGFNLAQ